jgi:hypothetical protein
MGFRAIASEADTGSPESRQVRIFFGVVVHTLVDFW